MLNMLTSNTTLDRLPVAISGIIHVALINGSSAPKNCDVICKQV